MMPARAPVPRERSVARTGDDRGAANTRRTSEASTATCALPPRLTPGDRARALGHNGPPIPTGIATIDRMTRGGFRAGGLIVVAGAPGAFKTALVVQLARKWVQTGCFVAVLAADEAADGLLIRFGQGLGLARGALEDGDPEAQADLGARLDALPGLSIFDADGADEGATVENVSQWLTDGAAGKPAVLIVDSLQTVRADGTESASDPRARMGAAVAALKLAARRGILVVTTCELARGAYRSSKASDRTELLASLKESGAIEYGATVVIGLRSIRGENGVVIAETAKNRLGPEKPAFELAMDFERATLSETSARFTVTKPGALAVDPKTQLHGDIEALRQILRDNPGINGNERLCAELHVAKTRARDALRALTASGEIENRGTKQRPEFYLRAPKSPPSPESPQESGASGESEGGRKSPQSPDPFRGEGDGESPGETGTVIDQDGSADELAFDVGEGVAS